MPGVDASRRSRRRLLATVATVAALDVALAVLADANPAARGFGVGFMLAALLSLPVLLAAPLACRVGRRQWRDVGRGLALCAAGAVCLVALMLAFDLPRSSSGGGHDHRHGHHRFLDGFEHVIPS